MQKISLKDLGFCILEFGEMKKMHEKAWISREKSKGTTMVLVASDGLMMRKSQRSKLHSQRWYIRCLVLLATCKPSRKKPALESS